MGHALVSCYPASRPPVCNGTRMAVIGLGRLLQGLPTTHGLSRNCSLLWQRRFLSK